MAEKRKLQLHKTDEDPTAKNRPKKKTYHQNFHQEYRTVYPALRSSAKGPQFALCTVCKSDFSFAHGGKNDCKKHCDTQSHPSLTLVQHVRGFSRWWGKPALRAGHPCCRIQLKLFLCWRQSRAVSWMKTGSSQTLTWLPSRVLISNITRHKRNKLSASRQCIQFVLH